MDVHPDPTQELLLAAAKRQDEGAVIALIERCQRQIVSAIVMAGVQRGSADFDDAQNLALFEIWKAFPKLRADDAVCSWMHGITRRTTTSRVIAPAARQRRRDERARNHTPPNSLHHGGHINEVSERDRLGYVLAELSDDHREVLILRFIEGYNVEETAKILGKPVKTISTRTVRAKRAAVKALRSMSANEEGAKS